MKLRKIKLFSLLLILPLLIYFWPVQLSGNTSYILLLGDSMYPTIESGTFVIVKPEQEYFLGDIIAFVNEDNRNVVHRIVEQTDEGFITKGDNNRNKDPKVVPLENVVGRSIFVAPYVGFTSLFLQTPLGISIFGIWALTMFAKSRPKKSKKEGQESFLIFKIGFISVLINYIMTQCALGININSSKLMNIPFSNILEPSIANTVSFSMLSIAIFMLYFFVRSISNKKTDETKFLKLIFSLGGIMILVLQLISIINIIPFFVNIINEQELISSLF